MGAAVVIGLPIGGALLGAVAGGTVGWLTENPSDLPGLQALAGVAVGAAAGGLAGLVAAATVIG